MSEKEILEQFEYESAKHLEQIQRRGKDSDSWCFVCGGVTDKLTPCACGFGDALRCVGHDLCNDCREAHGKLRYFIREILAAPRFARANSVRSRLFRELRAAVDVLATGRSVVGAARLHQLLGSRCDTIDQSNRELQNEILAAFADSTFLSVRDLVSEIEQQRARRLEKQLVRLLTRIENQKRYRRRLLEVAREAAKTEPAAVEFVRRIEEEDRAR